MASEGRTPGPNLDHSSLFKMPPVPRKQIDKTSRFPLSKAQACGTELASSSPCVQLGQKRGAFPFSPASTPKTSLSNGSRFFCEDGWESWKENLEKVAVTTFAGPRPPTPPSWVATPHRSGLRRDRRAQSNGSELRIRRRLLSAHLAQKEKTDAQNGGLTAVKTPMDGADPPNTQSSK